MRRPRLLRMLVLPLAAAGLLAGGAPAQACSGKTVEQIIYQATRYGAVTDGYSAACLQQARSAEGPDISGYTDADQAIRLAIGRVPLVAQIAGRTAPRKRQLESFTPVVRPASTAESGTQTPTRGYVVRFLNAGANGPEAVPLPVIVLGGLAGLLIVAGAASVLVRRRLASSASDRGPGA